MKILLISNMFPSSKDPLFGVFVKNFKWQLENKGIIFSGVSIIKGKTSSSSQKFFRYLQYYISILKNYILKNYDLVYVHYLSHNAPILVVLLFLFKKKKPIVVNVHGSDVINSKGRYIEIFNKFVLKRIDLLVVPSRFFKEIVLEQYPFLLEKNIFISPSGGINTKEFYYVKRKPNECLTIGLVSRIDAGKGWEDFLNALKRVEVAHIDFKVIIVGSGKQDEHLKNKIKLLQLNKKVKFLGLIPQSSLVTYFNKMDVMVFPTKKEESLGLVGLEAMSCGVPVIGSNIAGIKTYLDDGFNGYLFPPGNVEQLSKSIISFNDLSVSEKEKLSQNARQTAQKYDATLVTEKLIERLETYVAKN